MLSTVLTLSTADSLHQLQCPMDSSIEVGSAPECEIVLDGEDIRARHCSIRRMGERRFQITRLVAEAIFTVNGVQAAELEVETPFRFGIGDEVITFDVASENDLARDAPVPDSSAEPAADSEAARGTKTNPPRPARRDYLLMPNQVRPLPVERMAAVVVERSASAPETVSLAAPSAPSSLRDDEPQSESDAETRDESSPLVFAGFLLCGLMVAAIIHWQHHLEDAPETELDQTVRTPAAVSRAHSDDEILRCAAELRRAGAAALAAPLVMPLAGKGNADAMCELALALPATGGSDEDAVNLLRTAAEGGSREALTELVRVVDLPSNPSRHDPESFGHLQFAAQLGMTSAWMPLGERFELGLGVGKSLDLAVSAYKRARAAGDRRATAKLAADHDAVERVAAFIRSWNEVSVSPLLEHLSPAAENYFGTENPAMEAMLRTEERLRSLWPLRRISVSEGGHAMLRTFEEVEVTQPFQFELQRGARILRGDGRLTCLVRREEDGWRVVSALDEVEIKERLPAADQFITADSLRALSPAFSRKEQMEETRMEILEKLLGLEQTQDFKPALAVILNAAMTFPQEEFWRPFADKLCDRMARELFSQGQWLDASWAGPVHQLAELGSVSAMLLEGHLLMAGYGYSRDERRGAALYQKAFESGRRGDARFYYAEALFQGRGVVQDIDKAGSLALSMMARSKHPLEAYLAAHLLWRKAEVAPSLWQDVYDTLSRVAEKHPPAKHLAAMVLINHGNTTRERRTGFSALQAAAEAGVQEAMKNLAKCYQDGVGCEKDLQAAALWKQKAAISESLRRRHYTEFQE